MALVLSTTLLLILSHSVVIPVRLIAGQWCDRWSFFLGRRLCSFVRRFNFCTLFLGLRKIIWRIIVSWLNYHYSADRILFFSTLMFDNWYCLWIYFDKLYKTPKVAGIYEIQYVTKSPVNRKQLCELKTDTKSYSMG